MLTTSIVPRVESPLSQLRAEPVPASAPMMACPSTTSVGTVSDLLPLRAPVPDECHAALEMGPPVTSHAWPQRQTGSEVDDP